MIVNQFQLLIENQSSWLKLNFSKIYNLKAALVSIIQRDDLQLEEFKIWDYVIQWGIAQNKNLPSNLDDWIGDRFVWNHGPRKIFQITNFEIVSWIDTKEVTYDVNNNPYELNLILRGSRDGLEKDVFWNLCDHKINFVVIIKVKNTDEILDGYNPIFLILIICETNDSFIFSLKNRNIKNYILSRVKVSSEAIYNSPDRDPNFWEDFNMNESQSFEVYHRKYEKLTSA
ncbi:hypothetical protein Glove_50g63 [Diversispora epigaea]|uniref:TLDc domain-containing protein n=1 Tax=Diversispora epigaea TaxID=1348612 RepID=A0A397JDY8_9GLOM|nr:hypothetical protein Glove_50g63 [Diversispora epigaea]